MSTSGARNPLVPAREAFKNGLFTKKKYLLSFERGEELIEYREE
jgi:hypothetical protein